MSASRRDDGGYLVNVARAGARVRSLKRRPLPGARRLGLGPSATNEKILKNELAFAALKRPATPATFNLVVWWQSRLGANKLVLCGAVRAVEARCFGHGVLI
jgi:hypothetical protein